MKSFLESLEKNESIVDDLEKRFEVLDMIEPSFFTDKVNIIELVISNLFKKFSKELEKNELKDYDKKRKLLKEFQEIFKSLKYMGCKEEYQNSEIEELLMLSTTVFFKEKLQLLVKDYLEFVEKDKLIISVDDIDFNMNHAYEMVEGIRKYLTLDDVIIIINLKMEQLFRAIQEKYSKEIKELMIIGKEFELKEELEDRTERYLLKLLPLERRIYLKEMDEYDFEVLLSLNSEKTNEYKREIVNTIKKKTGMKFDENGEIINNLIPKNLRELIGAIAGVNKIKDRDDFIKYILDYCTQGKLNLIEQRKIKLLLKETNKNKKILSELLKGYSTDERKTADLKEWDDFVIILKEMEKFSGNQFTIIILKIMYSKFFYDILINNDEKELKKLLGKDWLRSLEHFNLFELKLNELKQRISPDELEVFDCFIFEEEKSRNETEEKGSFSIIAPFNKLIYKNLEEYKNLFFKDIEILEKFYNFLEKENKVRETSKWKDEIKKFYNETIEEFISELPENLKDNFKVEIIKLKNKVERILDMDIIDICISNTNINEISR